MKKILIVADSMVVGGIEKSICSLIHAIDKKQYNIDLLLVEKKGAFLDEVRGEVRILPQLYQKSIRQFWYRALLSLRCRSTSSMMQKEKYHSLYYHKIFGAPDTHYDVAIGCHNGKTQAYVAEKVNADIKIIQNHCNYADSVAFNWVYPEIDREVYKKVNYVVTVSESAREALVSYFPEMKDKIKVIHNIVNKELIQYKAMEYEPYENRNRIKIVTVCRIGREKGLDMIVPIATVLKKKGYDFVWYIVGEGDYKEELQREISNFALNDIVKLEGEKANPYPYMYRCDIYVQPSYTESWGLTVQEALILGKYVVATNLPAFCEQIISGKNGIIAEISVESLSEKICEVIEKGYYQNNCCKEKESNNEVEKYYELFKVIKE